MGNTCKSMADSFQCMTKPTTIKKKTKMSQDKKKLQNLRSLYTLESYCRLLKKLNKELLCNLAIPLPGKHPQRIKNIVSNRYLYTSVHSNIIDELVYCMNECITSFLSIYLLRDTWIISVFFFFFSY